MALYVIADLHLSVKEQRLCAAFVAFVKKLKPGDKLIISGDFFNFFVGIDLNDSCHLQIKNTLQEAKDNHIAVFFQHGNRDFLITPKEAEFFNFTLLPDHYVDNTGPEPCLIMHGDSLCTNDLKYQRFKEITSKAWLQRLFFALPLWIRKKIALSLRDNSQNTTQKGRDPAIYGIVFKTLEDLLVAYNCNIVIHGHLHQFGEHQDEVLHEKKRFALGDWGKYYSFVKIDDKGAELCQYPLSDLL